MVIDLSKGMVEDETRRRERVESFEPSPVATLEEPDISLYLLQPRRYARLYRVPPSIKVDVTEAIDLPRSLEVIFRKTSTELNTTVIITRTIERPQWLSELTDLQNIEHHLFVVHYQREASLLFMSSSKNSERLYEHLVRSFTYGNFKKLPMDKINRVLATLHNFDYFNIGLHRLYQSGESYRIMAGSRTQNELERSDSVRYCRGHIMGAAEDEDGNRVNIGYSSSSKVWSSSRDYLPDVVEWYAVLAERIESNIEVSAGAQMDLLTLGQEAERIPDGIIAIDWDSSVYLGHSTLLRTRETFVAPENLSMLDLGIIVDYNESGGGVVRFRVIGQDIQLAFDYLIDNGETLVECVSGPIMEIEALEGGLGVSFEKYLQLYPPQLFFSDLSTIIGTQLLRPNLQTAPFEQNCVLIKAWSQEGVDIQIEADDQEREIAASVEKISIHKYVMDTLSATHDIVFYDHGAGEVADFITIRRIGEIDVEVALYHCKKSGSDKAGARIDDVYEVAGQAVKCVRWIRMYPELIRNILRRDVDRDRSFFVKGNRDSFEEITDQARKLRRSFKVVIVQPGISRSKITDKITHVLGSVDEFLKSYGCEALEIWGSS